MMASDKRAVHAREGRSARSGGWDKRALGFSVALGAVLALTMFVMVDLVLFREMPDVAQSAWRMPVLVGASLAVFAIMAAVGYFVMTRAGAWIERASRSNPWTWLPLEFNGRSIALCALIMLLLWTPYIVLQFPGGVNFDTFVQIYQYMDPAPTYYDTLDVFYDAEYIDHHPVLDTLLYGTFFWIGYQLGMQNLGIFMASFFQTLFTAVVLSASCCYLARLGVPKVFRIVSMLFCALFPFIPLWSMALMKDALQAPCFVAFMLCFLEVWRTRGEALRSKKWLVCLIVFGCLTIVTKKTGVAVIVPALVILAVYCAVMRRRAIIAAVAVPIVCFAIVPLLVYPAIGGVHAGGTQEGLGFAMQQVMTVIIRDDDLTESERAAVERVLDIDQARAGYAPQNVDQVKNKTYPDATRDDFLAFLGAYASIGLRHPLLYTESSLNISAPFFSPGAAMTYYGSGKASKNFRNWYNDELKADGIQFTVHQPEELKPATDAFDSVLEALRTSPFGQLFFGRGFYGGWVPLMCLFFCLYRDKRFAIAFAPVLLYMATLLICPVPSARYMLGLLYITPLLLGLACSALGRTEREAANTGEPRQPDCLAQVQR